MAALHIVNPSNRSFCDNRYVLWFGACGPTFLMVWEHSLEDALETAAGWLADNAPGLIMPAFGEEHMGLLKEACEERGLTLEQWQALCDAGDGTYSDIQEDAEADLTYTEAGYLTSYEWGIVFDDGASRADVKAWIADLEARHYSDTPAVQVG